MLSPATQGITRDTEAPQKAPPIPSPPPPNDAVGLTLRAEPNPFCNIAEESDTSFTSQTLALYFDSSDHCTLNTAKMSKQSALLFCLKVDYDFSKMKCK